MALVGLSSCATKSVEEQYKLDLKIEGIQSGMAYLRADYPFSDELMDSAKIVKGECLFEGKVSSPLSAMLIVKFKKAGLTVKNVKHYFLMVENKSMNLFADVSKEDNLIVKGSPIHDDLKSLQESYVSSASQRELWAKMDIARNKGEKENVKELQKEYNNYLINLIPKDSKSIALSYLVFCHLINYPCLELEKIIQEFDPSIANTRYIKHLQARIDRFKRIEIGKVAPDFILNDTLGHPLALSSLRGKYVMVDFWASWCRPCCEELPEVVELYNKYNEKGFEILGVSLDSEGDKWKKAIKKYNMIWPNVSDLKFWDSEVAHLYNISSLPNNIILDPEGRIIAKNLHGEELNYKLEELFGF